MNKEEAEKNKMHLSGASLSRANLSGASLSGASLSGADLSGASLSGASLSGANLSGADLSGASLSGASLSRADLYGANLSGASLSRADLSRADLSGANLSGANLSGADLYGASLSRANLSGANLFGADLSRANLFGAKLPTHKEFLLALGQTRIIPEVGSFIGWKKCRGSILVKLEIPEKSKRSHAFGRKCRAEFVLVKEVVGTTEAISLFNESVIYRVGEIVKCNVWEEDWTIECGGGIHFYITRIEAENHI